MSIPQPIYTALQEIAERLEHTPITWAITASCSLALQGVPVVVHDIDLRTDAQGAYALEAIFLVYQKRPVLLSSTGRVRSHFGAFELQGVEVEIIGDMQHILEDGSWEPLVDIQQHMIWVMLDHMRLPVMTLEYLYEAYQLLGRADKVALVARHLSC